MALWPQLRSARFALFLLTLSVSLIRARNQPGLDVPVAGTTATVVPGDLALVLLAVIGLTELARRGIPRVTRLAVCSALAFSLLVVATGAANGSAALVSATKVTQLTALGIGAFA